MESSEELKPLGEDMFFPGKEYGLTYRQELFCMYYLRHRNKSLAYRLAYQCSPRVANVNAFRLWKKPKIRAYFDRLRCMVCIRIGLNVDDSIERILYLDDLYASNPYHWEKEWQPN